MVKHSQVSFLYIELQRVKGKKRMGSQSICKMKQSFFSFLATLVKAKRILMVVLTMELIQHNLK